MDPVPPAALAQPLASPRATDPIPSLAKPERPLNLPQLTLRPVDLQNNLQRVIVELTRVQRARITGVESLTQHLKATELRALNEIETFTRILSKEISDNRKIIPEKRVELMNRLLTAYPTAMGGIAKVVKDQTDQANILIKSLNIQAMANEVNATITKAIDAQKNVSGQIITIPAALRTKINAEFAPFESTMKKIRSDLRLPS